MFKCFNKVFRSFNVCMMYIVFPSVPRLNGHSKAERVVRDTAMGCDSGSIMSSELESSSFIDSGDEEDASRLGFE